MNIQVKPAVISVDAAVVHAWLKADQAVLVDVRETSEFEQEHIPGALLQPMSVFDPELFPTVPGKKVVLHCAVGKRSQAAGKMLLQQGHVDVIHMSGGINSWKEQGFETEVEFLPPMPEEAIDEAVEIAANGNSRTGNSVKPGQVLVEEFMQPHQISASELSLAVGIDPAIIDAIITGDAAITAAYSLRLARYFCTDDDFWLHLQLRTDLEEATQAIGHTVFNNIQPRLCA